MPDADRDALVRAMLARVADRWTLFIIDALHDGGGTLRFGALAQAVPGISRKMLTRTLRLLERDGLVARQAYAVVPPRVDYALTPLGAALGESLCGLWLWASAHIDAVAAARARFDADPAHQA